MSSPPVTIRAISSSPVTINDSSVDLITSSSVSPDRTSPVSIVKIEQFEEHQVKNVSIGKICLNMGALKTGKTELKN